MKRSLIWTAAGAAIIGFGVPAYAAVQTSKPQPAITTVKTTVEDVRGNCDEAEHATDPACATVATPVTPVTQATQPSTGEDDTTTSSIDDHGNDSTVNSIDDHDDDATENSVDDSTSNTVEDISGPCDEAEHANDPRCTGAPAPVDTVDDNSSRGGGADDSGRHHTGNDDSGDDNGHGGNDG